MSRSVAVPSDAIVAFQIWTDWADEDACDDISDRFDDLREFIQAEVLHRWPSFIKTDRWIGREYHALAYNKLCWVGMSEYCGQIAIWMIPKGGSNTPMAVKFMERVENNFVKVFGRYRLIGHFSNGEAVFEKMEEPVWKAKSKKNSRR